MIRRAAAPGGDLSFGQGKALIRKGAPPAAVTGSIRVFLMLSPSTLESLNVEKSDISRHMTFKPDQPYNDLPDLPPGIDIETKTVLKACTKTRVALAALRQGTALIPNPAVLINSIPMLEAQASSQIENIVTTTDALFRHAQLDSQPADPATKEALRYRTALKAGFDSLSKRPMTTRTAEEVCTIIKDVRTGVRKVPGTKLATDMAGEIVYTPPEGESRLREKLANWERFVHDDKDIDPVVRMAVSHYQFEAIHPFTDGNGRTGRILSLLMLVEQDVLDLPVLYLSRYIIRNRAAYYDALLRVTTRDAWQEWILYMLHATEDTARWTLAKINAVRALIGHTAEFARKTAPKQYSSELIELIFVQPYCRIENVVEAGIAKRQTASTYLHKLKDVGILEETQSGLNKLFFNSRLLKLLTQDSNLYKTFAPK
jgi:Fic family protein